MAKRVTRKSGRQSKGKPQQKDGKGFKAWDNNFRFNSGNRSRQIRWLDDKVLKNKQTGVEVYRAK